MAQGTEQSSEATRPGRRKETGSELRESRGGIRSAECAYRSAVVESYTSQYPNVTADVRGAVPQGGQRLHPASLCYVVVRITRATIVWLSNLSSPLRMPKGLRTAACPIAAVQVGRDPPDRAGRVGGELLSMKDLRGHNRAAPGPRGKGLIELGAARSRIR